VNCAGFIKIDTNAVSDSTETYIEVLDGTRVHPETYEWARKMAVDALEYDEEDANPGDAIVDILQNPEKLKGSIFFLSLSPFYCINLLSISFISMHQFILYCPLTLG